MEKQEQVDPKTLRNKAVKRAIMKKAYIFVIITALLFGSMEVACKIGGASLDPFQLTFWRFAIGALVLLPFAVGHLRRHHIRLGLRDFIRLTVVGLLGVTISMSLFQISVMMCNASTISVLICVNPFFTMVFAHFMTTEKLNRQKMLILALAIAGIIFMLRPWDIQEGNTAVGMILMLVAALFFGLYTVAGKISQEKMGLMAQTSISFIMGSLAVLIILIITGRPIIAGISDNIPILIYTGLFVTGLGYYSYFKAIELSDTSTGAFAFLLKPAIAPVIALIVLRESILWNTVVGIVIILIASLLNIVCQKGQMSRGGDFNDKTDK